MKKRGHLVWIGLLVSFASVVSYFYVFARFPALRDFPWVNLPLVLLGAALSALGIQQALASASTRRRKLRARAGFALSLLLAAFFVIYIFGISYSLPEPSDVAVGLIQAPDFALTSNTGETVRLSDFAGRRVVLVFYRGFWWPFCISELQGLQSRLEDIRETGAEVLAVSADPTATTRDKLGKAGIEYPLLADPDLKTIDAYGVRHPSGSMGGEDIARPATFLIDRQGRIVWRDLTDNWRIRLRPERLLEQLSLDS